MVLLFPGREQAILPLRKLTTVNLNYAYKEDYKQLMSFLINWKSFKKLNIYPDFKINTYQFSWKGHCGGARQFFSYQIGW